MFVDLTNLNGLFRASEKVKPDLVVHTAALTDVELCEREPALAHHVNAELAKNVASACNCLGIKLVHISTDHLFDGGKAFCTEVDAVCPVNVYGRTKALAEEFVMDACKEALIIRTNFYGWGSSYRSSFTDRIYKSLSARKETKLPEYVHFTPIIVDELVSAVHSLISYGESGIFNVTGRDRISKYQFGKYFSSVFNFDADLVVPSQNSVRELKVARPMDMSLSNAKLDERIRKNISSLGDGLERLKRQASFGIPEELLNI